MCVSQHEISMGQRVLMGNGWLDIYIYIYYYPTISQHALLCSAAALSLSQELATAEMVARMLDVKVLCVCVFFCLPLSVVGCRLSVVVVVVVVGCRCCGRCRCGRCRCVLGSSR